MPQPATTTMQVQRAALRFAAPVQFDTDATAKERRFAGVAYGGGLITDHAYWDAVGFDLAGVTAAAPMPLLLQHDSDRVIGVIDQVVNDGGQLTIGGKLFVAVDTHAAAVAAKADAGAPWQLSVGIFPDSVEEVAAGASYSFNGRTHTGPGHVFRKARIREVSFVALGADASATASVFNRDLGPVAVATFTQGAPDMAEPTIDKASADALAAEKARADKAEADLAALREQFATRERAERETAVKALLGESFSADKAAPYMDMTPVQFGAVQAAMGELRTKLPEGFTTEHATRGTAGRQPLTPEAITKYRADNPGASYEQAFNALTGVGRSVAPTTF